MSFCAPTRELVNQISHWKYCFIKHTSRPSTLGAVGWRLSISGDNVIFTSGFCKIYQSRHNDEVAKRDTYDAKPAFALRL